MGEPFNPFGLFTGIFVPEALVRAKGISPGAKLTYRRLARYAGQDGSCYPAVPTLASEIGVGERQTQNYLAELEHRGLIRRRARRSESGQKSNAYEFLWHPLLAGRVKRVAPEGVKHVAPEGVQYPSPKESHLQESQIEERNCDLDSPPTNRKKRDSRMDVSVSRCTQYLSLREVLAHYMVTENNPEERVYPSDRQVVDVMDAAAGASEEEVICCLRYLKEERGLRPGTRNGPRHFAWFKTAVGDYFQQKRLREMVYRPTPADAGNDGLSTEQFRSMTEAFGTYE